MAKMEFNSDILGVIRGFAEPRMQHVNEFAEAQRFLRENNIGYSHSLHEGVKAKLSTGEADQVFEVFRVYIEATMVLHEAGKHLATNKNAFTVQCSTTKRWRICCSRLCVGFEASG